MPNDLIALIADAAQRYGVNPQALVGIGKIESGLNPNARNPRSSAGGLFQFIDSTAKQYGLANKFDPGQAADAAARLARDNQNLLAKALQRNPTPGELYLAHQQGAGGAAKLLTHPDAPAASLVGDRAVALNGGKAGMTAQQFAQLWAGKLDGQTGAPLPPERPTMMADALPAGPVAPPVIPLPDLRRQRLEQQAAAEQEEQARRQALFGGGVASLYG